jgi:glycine/D-amino acid oxidase-like deaminating enzyme
MTIHVIGAGVAGLAAALRLTDRGRQVVLHEAAPRRPGGRARALAGRHRQRHSCPARRHTAALGLLKRIGAMEGWVEPEPAGLPVLDRRDGRAFRVALSPFRGATRRSARRLLRPGGVALARLSAPWGDRPVAEAMAAHPESIAASSTRW